MKCKGSSPSVLAVNPKQQLCALCGGCSTPVCSSPRCLEPLMTLYIDTQGPSSRTSQLLHFSGPLRKCLFFWQMVCAVGWLVVNRQVKDGRY